MGVQPPPAIKTGAQRPSNASCRTRSTWVTSCCRKPTRQISWKARSRKNNGELPQYYIKDNHPAIIQGKCFIQIQEEIARRKSKKPANAKKAKTNRGRFTSKYALSERLVCGNCGCYFRRVTWSIHGRKQIVWRCINRLECGPKVCKDSPSLKEDELYSAILKAIRSLVQATRRNGRHPAGSTYTLQRRGKLPNQSPCDRKQTP